MPVTVAKIGIAGRGDKRLRGSNGSPRGWSHQYASPFMATFQSPGTFLSEWLQQHMSDRGLSGLTASELLRSIRGSFMIRYDKRVNPLRPFPRNDTRSERNGVFIGIPDVLLRASGIRIQNSPRCRSSFPTTPLSPPGVG